MLREKQRILILGCTPPPVHGQALMIERLATAHFHHIKSFLVRTEFSSTIGEVGKVSVKKIVHIAEVITKAIYFRFRYNAPTLYYSPGGSTLVPVMRDALMLSIIRPFFKTSIFHFHSAGTGVLVARLPAALRWLARRAYRHADLGIYLSARNLDNDYLQIPNTAVVPNGLGDAAKAYLPFARHASRTISLLFVGVVKESKGIMVLLEAIVLLRKRGVEVICKVMGSFDSQEFEDRVTTFCRDNKLNDAVDFVGVRHDRDKWQCFVEADIFCFPSFYESESFGNVIVEAMMFELPVVATRWRGIPDIVEDAHTGFLVNVRDYHALANAVEELALNADLRTKMGRNGRKRYLERFSEEVFLANMERVLLTAIS